MQFSLIKPQGSTSILTLVTSLLLMPIPSSFGSNETNSLKAYTAEEFYETTTMTGLSFSHDEKSILVSSDSSKILNLYQIDATTRVRKQMTFSKSDAIRVVSYFPHDDRILFSKDQGGNELYHLYVQAINGKVVDLTPGEDLTARFLDWSEKGDRFWIITNERNPRDFDLYEYSSQNYSRKRLFENTKNWDINGISPNGQWLALSQVRSNLDVDLYVWDMKNKDQLPFPITEPGIVAEEFLLSFRPDSKEVYYSTNQNGEFREAWKLDLSDKSHHRVIGGQWDVEGLGFSKNGRFRFFYKNENSQFKVYVRDLKEQKDLELPHIPAGRILDVKFGPSEKTLAFYVNGDASPSDLYVLNLERGQLKRLTINLNPKIKEDDLVEGEIVNYQSFDHLEVPAILYRPKQASSLHRVPAMIWVHGGPGGQSLKFYSPFIQYLVNRGIAVLCVNNRGSSGYGKTFFHASDRKHGDVDLKDCIHGKKFLEKQDWIQPQHIGIMGQSYGGYITVAALAFAPEEFKIGIDIFGITNWVRTLEQIPSWWHSQREALYAEIGDPEKDRDSLTGKSPLFHAEKIKRPLLVIQGANDPRVLRIESDDIVAQLKKNGIPVEYLLFQDEGHGFSNRTNRIMASETALKFILKYL